MSFKESALPVVITLTDITGKLLRSYTNITQQELMVERNELNAGVYFLKLSFDDSAASVHKLIFN